VASRRQVRPMSQILVVAYETASSPELRAVLLTRANADSEAVITLLVPATPVRYLLLQRKGRARETAQHMALSARSQLEAAGVSVADALVGNADPIVAIREELAAKAGYRSIVICTHPADVSRWLKAGVPRRAEDFGLPVTHVVVRSVAENAVTWPDSGPRITN